MVYKIFPCDPADDFPNPVLQPSDRNHRGVSGFCAADADDGRGLQYKLSGLLDLHDRIHRGPAGLRLRDVVDYACDRRGIRARDTVGKEEVGVL